MSRSKLRIVGPWPAWSPELREALLRSSSGEGAPRRVLIRILSGVQPQPPTLARLREQASLLSKLPANGMLRQLHVTQLEGSAALVYDHIEAPSLARILQAQASRGTLLPGRVCASICAQVARSLASFQRSLRDQPRERAACHRGPGTDDVLIQQDGEVLLTGASVGPPPVSLPGYSPPEGPGGEAALVYGIGALAAATWTSRRPPAAHPDPKRHKQVMRTVLTALQRRPGEPAPESLLRLVGACMQPLPADRPSLEMVSVALSRLADTMQGPTLHAWAGAAVPTTLAWSKAAPSRTETAPPPERPALNVAPLGQEDDPTALAPDARPDEDDETMVASPETARLLREQIIASEALAPSAPSDAELAPPTRLQPAPILGAPEPLARPTRPNQTLVIEDPELTPLPPVPGERYPAELGRNPTLMPSDENLEATRRMEAPKLRMQDGDEEPTVALQMGVGELSDLDLESEAAPLPPRGAPMPAPLSGAPEPEVMIGGISDSPPPPPPPEAPPKKRSWIPLAATMLLGFLAASGGAAWWLLRDPVDDIELSSGPIEQLPEEEEVLGGAETIAPPPQNTPAPEPTAETQPPSEVTLPPTEPEPTAEPEPEPPPEPTPEPEPEPTPEPPPEPEPTPEPEVQPEPESERRIVVIPEEDPEEDDEEAEAEAIVPRLGGGTPAPEPEPTSEPIKSDAGFKATFSSSNPAVSAMKVKCHQGTSTGTGPVTVTDAHAGPCRVQATTSDGMLVAFFTLQGPGSYVCFEGGSRECR
ncbi:MAG: hypothetical protein VX899_15650 [Myxococcota bacterium]|nr:hypothetical protein [Myxococcota bacterium]